MSIQVWRQRLRSAVAFRRDHGTAETFRRITRRMAAPDTFGKTNYAEELAFVRDRPIGVPIAAGEVSPMTINWFIPRPGRGSGGHLNIFRFVNYLADQGFECRVISSMANLPTTSAQGLSKNIAEWYFPLRADVYVGAENAPPAAISIATAWQTAYDVRNFQPTLHRCYFVQDFEPWFYPAGTDHTLAEATYRFGFLGVTAGTWLSGKLAADYGMTTRAVGFSYDRDLYSPRPRRDPQNRRVFFYARPATARRGFELGMAVLGEVARRLPDVTIVLAGGRLGRYQIPFKHEDVDIVDLDRLSELYNRCDVALVLSFSNLSLLPLELMACGVPVVSNRAPCTEWLLNDANSRLEPPTIEALAGALCDILQSPEQARRLREGGLAAAHATDWAIEGQRMGQVLREFAIGAIDASAASVGQHPDTEAVSP